MRIVMITNVLAPDKAGGLERYVRELADTLVAEGDDVHTISKAVVGTQSRKEAPGDPASQAGADARLVEHRYGVPSKSSKLFAASYSLRVFVEVRELIRGVLSDGRGAILHAHYPIPALALVAARQPYVYTFHAPVHQEILSERQGSYALPKMVQFAAVSAVRAVERLVVRHAARVICLSEYMAAEAGRLGVDRDGIDLIPGGVDLVHFQSAKPSHRDWQEPGLRIFAARRLVPRTGVEELVRAFALFHQTHPDARLRIAGEGPRRAAVESLIKTLEVGDSISLLGRISELELVAEYSAAHICVTPTQDLEGFGLSTAEAMSCGAVPLVTPISANPEVVRDLDARLICADASPEGIAAGLTELASDRQVLAELGARAPHFARRYSWAEVRARHKAVYASVRVAR